jgi:hypothetical protein
MKAKAIDLISEDNKQSYRKRIENDQTAMRLFKKRKRRKGIDVGICL